MPIQNQVTASVIIAPEATFGTAALAGSTDSITLRRVSSSLALGKDVFSSAEVRPDQQIVDMRHGTKRPGGGIEAELANVAFDPLIEALLRGTWTAGVSVLPAVYTTIAAAVVTGLAGEPGSTGTFIWTAGDPVVSGFKVGDVVRPIGAGFGVNANKNYRIISMTSGSNRTITVTPSPAVVAANAGTSFGVAGAKLVCGIAQRSFTVEQLFGDVDITELYTGMRVGSGAVRIPPNGMVTASFGFMGQNMTLLDGAASPYFTAADPVGTDGIFAGPQGSLRFAGAEQGVVTGVDINIDVGLSADPVVGRTTVPSIFYGTTSVTGNVSAYLEDKSLIDKFVTESEVELVSVLEASGVVAPINFMSFNLPRIKLGGATKTVGAQGGVIATFPFTALKANAANVDASTIVIQRGNT
jgi:hypothetical protein